MCFDMYSSYVNVRIYVHSIYFIIRIHGYNYALQKMLFINITSFLPIGFRPQELSASDRGKLQEAMAQVEVTNFVEAKAMFLCF